MLQYPTVIAKFVLVYTYSPIQGPHEEICIADGLFIPKGSSPHNRGLSLSPNLLSTWLAVYRRQNEHNEHNFTRLTLRRTPSARTASILAVTTRSGYVHGSRAASSRTQQWVESSHVGRDGRLLCAVPKVLYCHLEVPDQLVTKRRCRPRCLNVCGATTDSELSVAPTGSQEPTGRIRRR